MHDEGLPIDALIDDWGWFMTLRLFSFLGMFLTFDLIAPLFVNAKELIVCLLEFIVFDPISRMVSEELLSTKVFERPWRLNFQKVVYLGLTVSTLLQEVLILLIEHVCRYLE